MEENGLKKRFTALLAKNAKHPMSRVELKLCVFFVSALNCVFAVFFFGLFTTQDKQNINSFFSFSLDKQLTNV